MLDGLIAAVVATFGLLSDMAPESNPYAEHLRDPDVFSVTVTLGGTLPLIVRRRWPVRVFLVAYAAVWIHGVGDYSGTGPWVAMLFGLYTVAAYERQRGVALWCLAAVLGLGAVSVLLVPYEMSPEDIVVGSFGLPLAAWLLGDNVGVRRAYVEAVEDRAAHLEREQEAQARRAVVEERNRIARELHDIVAHSMSVMVVQAGAARRTLNRDPERATEAIGQIEATGRNALAEMRRLVGVLRKNGPEEGDQPQPDTELGPQPDIDRIPGLIDEWREVGMDAAFRMEGDQRPLPSGMELVLYRIVQEALTNVAKHAGPQATAQVTLTFDTGDDAVTLAVEDNGRGAAASGRLRQGQGWWRPSGLSFVVDDGRGGLAVEVMRDTSGEAKLDTGPQPAGPGAGHGLVGMAERVALYDGEMRWGARRGGGFRVWVRLPLPDSSDPGGRPARTQRRQRLAQSSGGLGTDSAGVSDSFPGERPAGEL